LVLKRKVQKYSILRKKPFIDIPIFDFIENKTEWDKMKRSSFKMSEKYNIQTTARKYIEVYSSLMD